MTVHDGSRSERTAQTKIPDGGTLPNVSELELNLMTLAAPDVATTVRSMLRLRLATWRISESRADDILLAAVELVSNACNVTPFREIAFRANFFPASGAVWIGAWDSSPFMPTAQTSELTLDDIDELPDDHEFGGWGLSLVRSLSTEFMVTPCTDRGKWVHATFKEERNDLRP